MAKKVTKKPVKAKRAKKIYYGIVSLKVGTKLCWVSKQDVNGWSLGLGLNNRNVWLTGIRFKSEAEVERAVGSKVVFIHLKEK